MHYLKYLNIPGHVFGQYGNLPRLREFSWTFMNTQMEPLIEPARLILGNHWWKRALKGPSMDQIDKFS